MLLMHEMACCIRWLVPQSHSTSRCELCRNGPPLEGQDGPEQLLQPNS